MPLTRENATKTALLAEVLKNGCCAYPSRRAVSQKTDDMFGSVFDISIIKKVEEQSKDDNNLFLIRNDNFSQNWQTPLEVVNYVKDNFNKIDEISIYDVYKK